MIQVGIIGGNGQVGTEVCLRMLSVQGFNVIGIVRNPSGSAVLRRYGVEVRHGGMIEAKDASRLLQNLDVILNLSLSRTGIPRTDRKVDRQIIENMVKYAKPGARLIFASTIMVYAPHVFTRLPDAYGLHKFLNERRFLRLCRRTGHEGYVLRLGHVLGDLQEITKHIKAEIQNGNADPGDVGLRASNTIFTASICAGIQNIGLGNIKPGIYDGISTPQWTWNDVFTFYGGQEYRGPSGNDFVKQLHRSRQVLLRPWKGLFKYLSNSDVIRSRLNFVMSFLPARFNCKMHAYYFKNRAIREIESLLVLNRQAWTAPRWRELRPRPLKYLEDPRSALRKYPLNNIAKVILERI